MTHLDELKSVVEKFIKRPLLIYGDPDVDGLMAMLLACQMLDTWGYKYSYYVNSNRHHGFTIQPSALSGYFVIAVDFDIPKDIMQALVDSDVAVLSLDHHAIQDEFIHCVSHKSEAEGIIINNQYPFEPKEDKYQSGAGVVYEAFSTCYPEFKSKDREAIVGITLLSDARPIENDKAKKYLKTTYSADPQTGYMGYLINSVLDSDFGFGVPRMDRNFIDYTFSPRVNALLRFGRETEAIDFILGKGISSSSPKKLQENLLQAMKSRSSVLELQNVKIMGVNALDFPEFPNVDITSFIGLMCNNVKGTGKSVLGFVYENGKVTRASFRGRYDDVVYLNGFRNLGIDANGHPTAFGIIDFEPTQQTWSDIDDLIGDIDSFHVQTCEILEVSNLGMFMTQRGMSVATENCYVRDMYRTYIEYKGSNIQEIKHTYKSEPFSPDDYTLGKEPDFTSKGESFKYILDSTGNKVTKYIEYVIDGKKVKSFGVDVKDGLILPMLEKGYIQLYVRERLN